MIDFETWEAGEPAMIDSETGDLSTWDGGVPYVYVQVESSPEPEERRIFIV